MKAAGITLSTVGAGGGSNPFLAGLAEQGGGRFYDAANPASIPDIFLKETQQVSGQQIIEEPFFPILTSSSPILRGLDQGLPRLRGYNGTTAKAAAQTVLVTARDDPLLAQWQYGLGRSVAWTSDSTGRWARDWLGWNGFSRFFSQLVAWTFPGEETGGIEAAFDTTGGQTTLHVESVEADGSPRDFYSTSAVVVGPDLDAGRGRRSSRSRRACTRRRSARSIPAPTRVRVTQTRPGSTPLGRTVGLVAPTAAEYRLLGANEPFLAALRGATGGTEVDDRRSNHGSMTFGRPRESTDLWPLLLVLALLLWPLDIALRRVSIGRREFVAAGGWLRALPRRGRATAARTATSESMLATRGRATSSETRAALRRTPEASATASVGNPHVAVEVKRPAPSRPAVPATPTPTTTVVPAPAPSASPAATATPPGSASDDTLARLRDAKRRARER